MIFLPYENFIIETEFSPEQVIEKLQGAIEKSNWLGWSSSYNKPFTGELKESSFKIRRKNRYRNYFLPVIKGQIDMNSLKATIHVKMRVDIGTIISDVAVFSIILYFLLASISISGLRNTYAIVAYTLPSLFLYISTLMSFKLEANNAKKDLKEVFEAKQDDSAVSNTLNL